MADQIAIKGQLNEIAAEMAKINKEAQATSKHTRELEKDLRIDPSNIDTIVQRFQSLGRELAQRREQAVALTKAMQDVAKIRDDPTSSKSNIAKAEKDFKRYEVQLERVTQSIKRLEAQTRKQTQVTQLMTAATKKSEEQWGKLEKTAKKFAATALVLVGVLVKLTTAAIESGQELYSLSRRYGASAESIQTWNRALQLATGEQDLFTQSLSVMTKGMSQIAAGRGVAFRKALQNIGLSYKEIRELSPENQFNTIIKALSTARDVSVRAAAAQQLLGDSGQTIARVFEQEGISIEQALAKTETFGKISSATAKRLNELGLELEAAKSQISLATAEIAVALAPAIRTFAEIIQNFVAPALNTLAKGFEGMGKGGQTFFLVVTGIILILPVVAKLLKYGATMNYLHQASSLAAASGMTTATAATYAWKIALTGLLGVLGLVVTLMGVFIASAASVKDLNNDIAETSKALSSAGASYTQNTKSYTYNTSERHITVDVNSKSEGNTPISQENAQTIAQLTAAEINKTLGDLIK